MIPAILLLLYSISKIATRESKQNYLLMKVVEILNLKCLIVRAHTQKSNYFVNYMHNQILVKEFYDEYNFNTELFHSKN